MVIDPRLKLLEKIKLQLTGYVYIGDQKVEGWKEPLSYYMFKCPVHGYVCNYVTGHDEKLLCPLCLKEETRKHAHTSDDQPTIQTMTE